MTLKSTVHIIGAGLAGSEAAWQVVQRGHPVKLFEMRPHKMTPAHHSADFAELVCTNSLRSDQLHNAAGLIKAEMRRLNSLIIETAEAHRVPAGGALAVDREGFSRAISARLRAHPLVEVIEGEVETLDPQQLTVIATGPLTSDALARNIQTIFKHSDLYFYDAAAPIIEKDSIDFSVAYYKSRYDKGEAQDYINCPMSEAEFNAFYDALMSAEVVAPKEFEDAIFFEGCMPFEEMARRGKQTLTFGPMKPVGLALDRAHKPYAVVQLRQDNAAASLYNIVGFQTHLTWPEQRRIIRMIPGLQNAEFARYGVMHRNTYLKSPLVLNEHYQCKAHPNWFFAGQMTGVEGYIESAASGLLAGINAARRLRQQALVNLGRETMMGAMAHYVTHADPDTFQPMNANFGLLNQVASGKKQDRKLAMATQALSALERVIERDHV
jgi:methylenetetrahydrofolate--tRNA-(uracil-5-)-methyltransferase